jgi:NADH-quinone oxidoreductase subunit L
MFAIVTLFAALLLGIALLPSFSKYPAWQHTIAALSTGLAAVAALFLLPVMQHEPLFEVTLGASFGGLTFIADGMSVTLTLVATVIGTLTVIFSRDYLQAERHLTRYYMLVLLFIASMVGLVLSGNVLMLFLFWEMTAFCSYALIGFDSDNPAAVRGSILALILTQIGGVGLLLGSLLIYSYSGSYRIDLLLANPDVLPESIVTIVAFAFLFAAAAKSAQLPFHSWLPGAMEAPSPISALIHAATMVNAGIYLLARFYPLLQSVGYWAEIVMLVGVLSALAGALMALFADDLKRVLAYSTISQLGYMIYAVGAGGIFASQFHLVSHAVFKALLFLAAGAIIHSTGTRDMRKMAIGGQMPFTRFAFLMGTAALVGIPMWNGFWSKELLLEHGLLHSPFWMAALMMVGVGLTALYCTRMVWMVFRSRPDGAKAHAEGMSMRLSMAVLAAGTLITGVFASPLAQALADTMPQQDLPHVESNLALAGEILSTPATWIALLLLVAGSVLWLLRDHLRGASTLLQPIRQAAQADFGFEKLNQAVIVTVMSSAAVLRRTQTGQLGWNLLAIVTALLVVLVLALAWGGLSL